jgi:hypothetical protein
MKDILIESIGQSPYVGTGVLRGRDYITFDGRHYYFPGLCEYVLAQDGIDGNFSVVVNYEREYEISSIVVVTKERRVEVKFDYTVLVDGQEVNLPWTNEDTVITRDWNTVLVTSNKGLSVSADLKNKIYIVSVNGYYFAKTQGLLGTYNYEPSDDFLASTGQNLTSEIAFMESWNLSNGCEEYIPHYYGRLARYGSRPYLLCESLFKEPSSPLSSAFKLIDSTPYMKVCLQDLSYIPWVSKPNHNVCRTAAAYSAVAKHSGLELELPHICNKLLSNKRDMSYLTYALL